MNHLTVHIKFAWVAAILALAGCDFHKQDSDLQQTRVMQKRLTMAPISETASLNLDPLWLLPQQGTYLQKVKATIQGQGYTFSLHVTIESQKIDLVAFNDLYGRLYQLTWEPNNLQWSASQRIPEALKPDNIIADFLLVHLPLPQLSSSITGASIEEKQTDQGITRVVKAQSTVLREIHCSKPLGSLWQRVIINNPQAGYKLDIQTVPLS